MSVDGFVVEGGISLMVNNINSYNHNRVSLKPYNVNAEPSIKETILSGFPNRHTLNNCEAMNQEINAVAGISDEKNHDNNGLYWLQVKAIANQSGTSVDNRAQKILIRIGYGDDIKNSFKNRLYLEAKANLGIKGTIVKIDDFIAVLFEMQKLMTISMSRYGDKSYYNKEGIADAIKILSKENRRVMRQLEQKKYVEDAQLLPELTMPVQEIPEIKDESILLSEYPKLEQDLSETKVINEDTGKILRKPIARKQMMSKPLIRKPIASIPVISTPVMQKSVAPKPAMIKDNKLFSSQASLSTHTSQKIELSADAHNKYRQAFKQPNMPLFNTSLNFSADGKQLFIYTATNEPYSLVLFENSLSVEQQASVINELNYNLKTVLPSAFVSHQKDLVQFDSTVLRQDRYMNVMANHNLESYGFKIGGNLLDFNKAIMLLREDLGVLLTANGGISNDMLKQLQITLINMTGAARDDQKNVTKKAVNALLIHCICHALKANNMPTIVAVESFSKDTLNDQRKNEFNIDILKNINQELGLPPLPELSYKDAIVEMFRNIVKPLTDSENKYQTHKNNPVFFFKHEQAAMTEIQKYNGNEAKINLQQLAKTLMMMEEYHGFEKLKATGVDIRQLDIKVMYFQPPVKNEHDLAKNSAYPVILIGSINTSGQHNYIDPLSGRMYSGSSKAEIWKEFAANNEFPSYGVLSYENEKKQLISCNIENTLLRRATDTNALIGLGAMITACCPGMQSVSAGLFSANIVLGSINLAKDLHHGTYKSSENWLGEILNLGISATLLGSTVSKGLIISNLIKTGKYSTNQARILSLTILNKINMSSEIAMSGMIATDGLKAMAEKDPVAFLSLAQNLILLAGARIMNNKKISSEMKAQALKDLGHETNQRESSIVFLKRMSSTLFNTLKTEINNLQISLKELYGTKEKLENKLNGKQSYETNLEIKHQIKSINTEIVQTRQILHDSVQAYKEDTGEVKQPLIEYHKNEQKDDNLQMIKQDPHKKSHHHSQADIGNEPILNNKPIAPTQNDTAIIKQEKLGGNDLKKYNKMENEYAGLNQNELYDLILQKRINAVRKFIEHKKADSLSPLEKKRYTIFELLVQNDEHISKIETKPVKDDSDILELMSLKKQKVAYQNLILTIDQVDGLVGYYEKKYNQLIVDSVLNLRPYEQSKFGT